MLKFNFRQRTIPVCRTDSKSSRAAGKSCFCNDEIFFWGDGYYIFAKRADYIYKEYDSYS